MPATERLLNQLLRFFMGSFKEPVEGWENTKVEFNRVHSEKPGFAESVIPECVARVPVSLWGGRRVIA